MAISIDATVGGASANSYLTLSDANAIIDGLVQDDDIAAWASATGRSEESCLVHRYPAD
jgi:hypothetical protein